MAKHRLGEIYGELRLKSTQWQKGFSQSKERMKDFALAGAKVFGMFTAAATALTAALTKITKDTVRYGVETDRMIKITGLAGEEITRLRYAIEQEHGSLQSLEKGLFNLTVRLGYAGDGLATYTRQFQTLGIEFMKADGTLKNTYDVFLDLVDVMDTGIISTEKMASVAQLLGSRVAKELIPFMKMGREEIERLGEEAEALGLVMSTKTAAGMKKVDDSITALKGSLKGFRNLIGERIAPAVETFTRTMVDAFIQIRKHIDDLLPSIADLGEDTETMGDIGVNFARKTITAIFTVMNVWKRLEVVYWTVRSAFNRLMEFHFKQYQILYETTVFALKRIAEVWDRIFKTNLSASLDGLSEKFKIFNKIIGDEARENWDNAEQSVAELNEAYKVQMAILDNLQPMTLHFSDSNKKLANEMDNLAKETGKANKKLQETGDSLAKTKVYTSTAENGVIDFDSALQSVGETMAGLITGKTGFEGFMKSLAGIGISLIPGGGFLKGLLGGMFGEGGVAVPKRWQPIFAAEGMAVAEKPTVSPGGNIFGERGWEVFLKGDQFKEILKPPTIIIHNANPETYVEIIRNSSESDKYKFGRFLEDDVLPKQRYLNR